MVLYSSNNLRVVCNNSGARRGAALVICFQYRLSSPDLQAPGFAEEFFERHPTDAVFVNCSSNQWWQYPDLPKCLSLLNRFAAGWPHVVTYGSSMGAYAALRFAAATGATSSIAVGPQYSPRAALVQGENRYEADICNTKFLHEDCYRISADVRNYVLYDPLLELDARHIACYRREASLIAFKVYAGGHTPSIILQQCGLLTELLLRVIAEEPRTPTEFRRDVRSSRRGSSQYWQELVQRLLERDKVSLARRVARESLRHTNGELGDFPAVIAGAAT